MTKNHTLFSFALMLGLAHFCFAESGAARPDIVIKNAALILTMDPRLGEGPLGVLHGGSIAITGDSISHVGGSVGEGVKVIDATGMIVMPGFVDTHNHLWQSLIRGCGLDKDLHGWLEECQWPGGGAIDEADTYALVRLSTLDLISTGVTTTTDWSVSSSDGMIDGNIRALKESGLRFVYAYFDWHCNVDDCSKAQETRRKIINFKQRHIDTNPLATLQTASHPIAPLAPSVRNQVALAKELGITFNAHYLENKNDPHGELNGQHPSMTAILNDAGAFDGDLLLNHAVHVSADEIALLAGHGARIAHNPLSNMRLASGVMPLPSMHAAGLTIGLGLDGGANDTSDFFSLMRTAVGLQRAVHLDAGIYPGIENVLRMATIGGAEALGLSEQIGSLTPGKQADLIIIDPHQINFAPDWDWVNQLVFNGQPQNVQYVFVAGRMLKASGHVPGDHQQTIRDAEAAVAKVKSRLGVK
jgi:5-methylthioadenosine/S-adenosylhomocysteine deaminase